MKTGKRLRALAEQVDRYGRDNIGSPEIAAERYPNFLPLWNEALAVLNGHELDTSHDHERPPVRRR